MCSPCREISFILCSLLSSWNIWLANVDLTLKFQLTHSTSAFKVEFLLHLSIYQLTQSDKVIIYYFYLHCGPERPLKLET
jgi:hypothetical protein